MKKSVLVIVIAIAFVFSLSTVNATPEVTTFNKSDITKVVAPVNPFCISIVKGDIETVKKLIELGANVNEKSNGMTPAMYAAKFNKVEILKLLVMHGADLKKRSDQGFTAEKYAKLSNAKEALEFLELHKGKKGKRA